MEDSPSPKRKHYPIGPGDWVTAIALTIPSAVLVGIMAEALSQDPLTRPDLPLPLFVVWFLGSWIVFTGGSLWITRSYWNHSFSLTGYIYFVTAFVVLFTVVPSPSSSPTGLGVLFAQIMIGLLAGTGLIALLASTIAALIVVNARERRNRGEPPPSTGLPDQPDQPPPLPTRSSPQTLQERFRARSERFSRTRNPDRNGD